jgi:hypothetical protein
MFSGNLPGFEQVLVPVTVLLLALSAKDIETQRGENSFPSAQLASSASRPVQLKTHVSSTQCSLMDSHPLTGRNGKEDYMGT